MNGLVFFAFLGLFVCCATACTHDGNTYKNGEEWTVRQSFVMKCFVEGNGWRTQVVACIVPNTNLRIPIDSSRIDGRDKWTCEKSREGVVGLKHDINPSASCDGHPVGSRWQDKSFELECKSGGIKQLKACVAENGQRIAVNSSREVDGFTLVCQQFANGTVLFHGVSDFLAKWNMFPTHFFILPSSGSHWIENHRFNKTCKSGGSVEVVNCITKEGQKVPLNGQVIYGNTKYACEMTNQGTIRYAAGPVQ